MNVDVYVKKPVITIALDTRDCDPEYLLEGWHVYDCTLLPALAGYKVIVAHGAPDGTLPLAGAIQRFVAAHPDLDLRLVCCHAARVAKRYPDLAAIILPEIAGNVHPAWIESTHVGACPAVRISIPVIVH